MRGPSIGVYNEVSSSLVQGTVRSPVMRSISGEEFCDHHSYRTSPHHLTHLDPVKLSRDQAVQHVASSGETPGLGGYTANLHFHLKYYILLSFIIDVVERNSRYH